MGASLTQARSEVAGKCAERSSRSIYLGSVWTAGDWFSTVRWTQHNYIGLDSVSAQVYLDVYMFIIADSSGF